MLVGGGDAELLVSIAATVRDAIGGVDRDAPRRLVQRAVVVERAAVDGVVCHLRAPGLASVSSAERPAAHDTPRKVKLKGPS